MVAFDTSLPLWLQQNINIYSFIEPSVTPLELAIEVHKIIVFDTFHLLS